MIKYKMDIVPETDICGAKIYFAAKITTNKNPEQRNINKTENNKQTNERVKYDDNQ